MAHKVPKTLTYGTWAEECAQPVGPAWYVIPVRNDLYLVDPGTEFGQLPPSSVGVARVILRDEERRQLAEIIDRERTRFKWMWRGNICTVHDCRSTTERRDGQIVQHRSFANRNRTAPAV